MTAYTTMITKTAFEWSQECMYITNTFPGNVPEMHHDSSIFLTYCRMQRDAATKDGQHDSAEYIQHVIDDLEHEISLT